VKREPPVAGAAAAGAPKAGAVLPPVPNEGGAAGAGAEPNGTEGAPPNVGVADVKPKPWDGAGAVVFVPKPVFVGCGNGLDVPNLVGAGEGAACFPKVKAGASPGGFCVALGAADPKERA